MPILCLTLKIFCDTNWNNQEEDIRKFLKLIVDDKFTFDTCVIISNFHEREEWKQKKNITEQTAITQHVFN